VEVGRTPCLGLLTCLVFFLICIAFLILFRLPFQLNMNLCKDIFIVCRQRCGSCVLRRTCQQTSKRWRLNVTIRVHLYSHHLRHRLLLHLMLQLQVYTYYSPVHCFAYCDVCLGVYRAT